MSFEGRWRIVEMELWDQDAIDLLGPASIEITADDQGSLLERSHLHPHGR